MKAENDTNKSKSNRILWFVGGAALTAVGFIVIPPLIKKASNKLYKASAEKDEVDFDNLGPEIVKKEVEEDE